MNHYIHIDYKFSHFFELENSEFPNVEEINGDIFFNDYENEPIKIGEIELHFYNYSFIDHGFNLYQAFDRSMNTIKLGDAILDYDTSELSNEVEELVGSSFNSNILVIHEFMIFSKFRGKGYGKNVIAGLENFNKGKCGYLALQSFPKQHDIGIKEDRKFEEYNLGELYSDLNKAQASLDSFYEQCGFIKIPSEDSFYVKNIDPM